MYRWLVCLILTIYLLTRVSRQHINMWRTIHPQVIVITIWDYQLLLNLIILTNHTNNCSSTPGHQPLPAAPLLCSTTPTPSSRPCSTFRTPWTKKHPWTWQCQSMTHIVGYNYLFISGFRFRQTAGLQGFLVQPNLVQHIGMVSSLTKKKDPLEFVDQIYRWQDGHHCMRIWGFTQVFLVVQLKIPNQQLVLVERFGQLLDTSFLIDSACLQPQWLLKLFIAKLSSSR